MDDSVLTASSQQCSLIYCDFLKSNSSLVAIQNTYQVLKITYLDVYIVCYSSSINSALALVLCRLNRKSLKSLLTLLYFDARQWDRSE